MVVDDKHATILDYTGNKVDVRPFILDIWSLEKVSIVDESIQYTFQCTTKVYTLVFSNAP